MKIQGYRRWLLSYLPVFFIIISVLILIFFFAIGNYSKKQTEQTYEVFARHVMQAMDSSLQFTESMIIKELLTDEKLRLFYEAQAEPTPYQYFEISQRLRDLTTIFPPISSIYLYRLEDRMVLTPNSMVPLSQFGDRGFVEQAMNEPMPYAWTGNRVYNEFYEGDFKTKVVSLAKKVPLGSGSQGLLVVNILASSVNDIFSSLSESEISFVKLLDAEQKLFIGESRTGEKQLTSIQSPYTGWIIQAGMKNKQVYNFFSVLSEVWLVAGFATVLIGILWMIYLIRRNYKPIELMRNRVQQYVAQKGSLLGGKPINDEFLFINTAIDNLMEHSNSYEQRYKENLIFRRSWFFQQIIEGEKPISADEWQAETEKLGLPAHRERLSVAILEIDRYADFSQTYSRQDQQLLKFALKTGLQELAQAGSIDTWSEWISHNQIGVIFMLAKDDDNGRSLLLQFGETLRSWVAENMKFTISLGFGDVIDDIADAPHSYHDALAALQYKSTLGANKSIGYWEIDLLPQNQIYRHLAEIRLMAQSYRLGDEGWRQHMDRLFDGLKAAVSTRDDIVYVMNYAIYALQKEMAGMPAEIVRIWDQDALPKLNRLLQQFDLLQEIEITFSDILSDMAAHIMQIRESRNNRQLIHQVKEYIESHYSDPGLSLQQLSDEFQLNIKTLSRMFKDEFGENFIDYVARVRIEHSKTLLATMPDIPIHDISLQVGYSHAISFNRVFKKTVGVTPGHYRKQFVN